MAFLYKVKIIRAKQQVSRTFGPEANYCDVDRFIQKAAKMPATIRVEVDETDTQLYGYPMAQRTYPRAVLLKDGRAYKFYGLGANTAFLHDGPLRTFHVA